MNKIKIKDLCAVSYNPRIITSEQLERLKSSIKEHTVAISSEKRGEGYRLVSTVTINKNGNRIVGGHQRIKALKQLGQKWIHKDDITWVELEVDGSMEKALNITLNSDRFQGEWNRSQLDSLLIEIHNKNSELFNTLDLADIDIPDVEIETVIEPEPEPEQEIVEVKKEIVEEIVVEETEVEEDEDGGKNVIIEESEETKIAREETHEAVTDALEKAVLPEQKIKEEKKKEKIEKIEEDEIEDTGIAHADRLFPLSYAVKSKQRKIILSVISKAKDKYGLKTSAEAITKVCEDYAFMQDE